MEENNKKHFSNKTKIFIVILVLLIFLIPVVTFFLLKPNGQTQNAGELEASRQFDTSSGVIYFESPGLNTPINQPVSVNIYANSGGKPISGAVISVKFNPNSISNVVIEQFRDQNSALSNTFENTVGQVDYNEGLAWITLSFPKDVIPQPGSGAVARLTFTPLTNTILNFGDNSALLNRQTEAVTTPSFSSLSVKITSSPEGSQEYIPQ